jgi:hypothetical protein
MKVTRQTVGTVLMLTWGYALARWLVAGAGVDAFFHYVPVIIVGTLPFVATVFYFGHKHGYAERQAEIRAAFDRIPRHDA